MIMRGTAAFLTCLIFPEDAWVYYSWQNSLIHMLIFLVALPFMIMFFKKNRKAYYRYGRFCNSENYLDCTRIYSFHYTDFYGFSWYWHNEQLAFSCNQNKSFNKYICCLLYTFKITWNSQRTRNTWRACQICRSNKLFTKKHNIILWKNALRKQE